MIKVNNDAKEKWDSITVTHDDFPTCIGWGQNLDEAFKMFTEQVDSYMTYINNKYKTLNKNEYIKVDCFGNELL